MTSDVAVLTPLTVLPTFATSTYGSTTSTQNKFYNTTLLTSGTADTGGGFTRKVSNVVSSALSGATGVIAVNIPVGAKILGCQLRVDTAITGDGTTWSAAYTGGSTQAITSGQVYTKNTKVNVMFDPYSATPNVVGSPATITVTCTNGNFSAGVVRAVVYYDDFVALSNNP